MSAPFSAKLPALLAGPLRHEFTAQVDAVDGPAIPLAVTAASITFAEDWAPYAQAKVEAAVPDADALARIDPRRNVRLRLEAGYTLPDNSREVFPLADLGVRERPVSRPADTMNIDAGSDEYRAQDYRVQYWEGMERSGINEAVRWLAGYSVFPDSPALSSTFPARTGAAALEELDVALGDDYWSVMEDAAARTGARVWCDEFRTWRVDSRRDKTGTPALKLTVGEAGTIVTSEAGLSREDWANSVVLVYSWQNPGGDSYTVVGRAIVASGPFAPSVIGHKVHHETLDQRPIGPVAANRAAATKLRNLITRGRSLTLSAAAAYWLRPGDTVEVTLPTGEPTLHLVRSVTFHPLTGLMDLTTRQPLDAVITNGE